MNYAKIVLLLYLTTFLVSCEKSEPFEAESGNGNQLNQTLIVTTTHIYRSNPLEDSLISKVTVKLYPTENSRELDINVSKTGATDSLGQVKFEYLIEPYYYAKAKHPVAGEVLGEVSIPEDAVTSFLDLTF